MRLYLSSFGFGNTSRKLPSLIGSNKRVAVIANSIDYRNISDRFDGVKKEIDALKSLGFDPVEIDLKNYFDQKIQSSDLDSFGMVWVRGGNSFILRRAFAESGFDEIIKQKLTDDEIVYGGYSAGACVMGSSLKGLELCDGPDDVPAGYNKKIIWDGLGLVDGTIVPHYRSDHPESEMLEKSVEYLQANNLSYKTLRDGEAIIVSGNR